MNFIFGKETWIDNKRLCDVNAIVKMKFKSNKLPNSKQPKCYSIYCIKKEWKSKGMGKKCNKIEWMCLTISCQRVVSVVFNAFKAFFYENCIIFHLRTMPTKQKLVSTEWYFKVFDFWHMYWMRCALWYCEN